MTNWQFPEAWAIAAAIRGTEAAIVQGPRRVSWKEFEHRSTQLAGFFQKQGLGPGSGVAQYLYNSPEYLETVFASLLVRAMPVNTNYRYTSVELAYLWNNADAKAVVFHGTFAGVIEGILDRTSVSVWLWVDDGSGPCPGWAIEYERVARDGSDAFPKVSGSGDDLLLLYTGGTTGVPKGVMWRQDDLFCVLNRLNGTFVDEEGDMQALADALLESRHPAPRCLLAPPLMHGTGLFTALGVLIRGGTVVLPSSRSLDPEELLSTVELERITEIAIVGDVFSRPLIEVLEGSPQPRDLSSVWLIVSSGVMWSANMKSKLLGYFRRATLIDSLGSSEAMGIGRSMTRNGASSVTARFELGKDAVVLAEDGRAIAASAGERGRLALRGRGPSGYYKDPEKSKSTFAIIDGIRFSIPGDYAVVLDDGTVELLGRGSGCINTGGEKVFPEEVEEVLKLHRAVADASVVGLPDDLYGETICALVELRPQGAVRDSDLKDFVRARLAGFKVPKRILVVAKMPRSANGKMDYVAARRMISEANVTMT